MSSDILIAIALFCVLLLFYWLNEPRAQKRERKNGQRQRYRQHDVNARR